MQVRRPHKKSRFGCTQCKRRHIKCDEGQPLCDNCIDSGLACEYTHLLREDASRGPQLASIQSPDPALDWRLQGKRQAMDALAVNTSTTFDLFDLELLHHWFSTEIVDIIHRPQPLKSVAFRLGLANTFVLHGILALSALHLGHVHPNRRNFYLVKSFMQQDLALQVFRTTLQNVSANNCEAVAAFSILLLVQSYGDHRIGLVDDLEHIDRTIISMELVRGAATIIISWKDIIRDGEMSLIFGVPVFSLPPIGEVPELIALSNFLDKPPSELNAVAAKESAKAAVSLHRLFAINCNAIQSGVSGIGAVLSWPCQFPASYIELLREREPCALVVLAYYVVLLQQYDSVWVMQEWTSKLLSSIDSLLKDVIWEGWMEWPKQMISKGFIQRA